jgi:hypothetical protein
MVGMSQNDIEHYGGTSISPVILVGQDRENDILGSKSE